MNPRALALITTHIAPAQGYGGVAVSTANLVRQWARQERSFAVCSSDASHGPALRPQDIEAGPGVTIRLYRAYVFRRWGFGLGAMPALAATCFSAPAVYINGIATWPTTLAAVMCRLIGRRYMIAVRGGMTAAHVRLIREGKPHKWLFYRLLTLPTLRHAAAIHCTSALERDGVLALLPGIDSVRIIPNGVDLSSIQVSEKGPGKGLILGYVGRISKEKGINRFIRVWRRCRQPHDRLIVAGSGTGPYFSEFQRLVGEADGAISFKGYLDAAGVADVIASSDFLVLPSGIEDDDIRENFGNAVAEALAHGCPALVTRGLAWDKIEGAGAGLLFGKDDSSLRDAIARARDTRSAAYRNMCKAARSYAEHNLDIAVCAQELWDVCTGAGVGRAATREPTDMTPGEQPG